MLNKEKSRKPSAQNNSITAFCNSKLVFKDNFKKAKKKYNRSYWIFQCVSFFVLLEETDID